MPYVRNDGAMYMMPAHFGPCVTPRQDKDLERFIYDQPTHRIYHTIVFESDIGQMSQLVPQGFEVTAPYVSVFIGMLREIAWLAGYGYNLAGVNFPVKYHGKSGTVEGSLLLVLWENHADPIITGREQLGYNKIFASIDDITEYGSIARTKLSSWGFTFLEMDFFMPSEPEDRGVLLSVLANPDSKGTFHHKYIPRTGDGFRAADAEYVTMTPNDHKLPADISPPRPDELTYMSGTLKWNVPRFEDMPTQFHIVQALGALEIKRYIGAMRLDGYSANDFGAQFIVE